jgi:hypothetical protein
MTEKLAVFTGKLAEAGVLNETQPFSHLFASFLNIILKRINSIP